MNPAGEFSSDLLRWLGIDPGADWVDVIDPEYPPTALIPGPDAWTYTAGMPEMLPAHDGWWARG